MQKFIIVLMERLQGLIAKKIVMGFIVKIQFILKNEIIVRIVFIVLGVFLMKKSAGKNQFGPIPKK